MDELAPVGLGKIQKNLLWQRTVARGACGQKKQRIFLVDFISFFGFAEQAIPVTELGFESRPHLRANFIAAPANSRANRRLQITRIGSEPAVHLAYAFFHDAFYCPSPARMKDAYRPPLGINQNYRKAICGQYPQQNSGNIGHHSITREQGIIFGNFRNAVNQVRVNLPQVDRSPLCGCRGAEGSRYFLSHSRDKGLTVAFHRRFRIVSCESQVQCVPAITLRRSTGASAEAVHQPW